MVGREIGVAHQRPDAQTARDYDKAMRQGSDDEPNRSLQARCREMEAQGALCASVFVGFPNADIKFAGLSAVVVTDNDMDLAKREAKRLADIMWSHRLVMKLDQPEPAEAVLELAGYVAASRRKFESDWRLAGAPSEPNSLRMVHCDDPWSVDLHTSLDLGVGGGGPVARLDAAKPLSSGRRWTRSPDALVLEQPLLLLHLAVHAGAGLQNLTLLRLVELHFVARRDLGAGRLSWEAFVELGQRTGSLGIAWAALKLCEELAPGTVPEADGDVGMMSRFLAESTRGIVR